MANYTVKVVHRYQTPVRAQEWNSYHELSSWVPATFTDFQTVGTAFATFHETFLIGAFTIDRVVISTWAKDGRPYNPDNVTVIPIGVHGAITGEADLLPWGNALHVQKQTAHGRLGKMFLHGYLKKSNVATAADGSVYLLDVPSIQSSLDAAFATLQTALGAAKLSLVSEAGEREVIGLKAPKLTIVSGRRKHKAFAPPSNPLTQMAHIVEQAKVASSVVNPIIELFNALPLPDVPLLP